jgi:hypothetical protein
LASTTRPPVEVWLRITCLNATFGVGKGERPSTCDSVQWCAPWWYRGSPVGDSAWRTDDFWRYALFAAVAFIRASSARLDVSVSELWSGWLIITISSSPR